MHKRVDANQKEIVDICRSLGASVQILSDVGMGCPDILIGYHGHNILVEIKDGEKPPSQQKLTYREEIFHKTWRGQVSIVSNIDEIKTILQKIYYEPFSLRG